MIAVGLFVLYATVLLEDGSFMTEQLWHLVSSSVIFCATLSHGSQFYENYRSKSTGNVAGETVFIDFFEGLCKTVIVLTESDDFMYIV